MFSKYEKAEESIFSKALNSEKFTLDLYHNEPEKFNALSLYERARLAHKYIALIEAMIANPKVKEDDIKAITSTFPDGDEWDLRFYGAINRKSFDEIQKVAQLLQISSPFFQKLKDSEKATMALTNLKITIEMINDSSILQLNDETVSRIATCLAMRKDFDLCLCFVKNNSLFAKLNPAARLIVLSRLKQIDFDRIDVPSNVINLINNAYSLPLDNKEQFLFWIPAISGRGDADYVGRFHEVLGCAMGTWWENQMYSALNRHATTNERMNAEALALILVQDKRFIDGFDSSWVPEHKFAVLKTEARIQLGVLYPRIAYELLTNPITQGKRLFTKEECEKLIIAHPGRNDISVAAIYFSHWKVVKEKLIKNPGTALSPHEVCFFYEQNINVKRAIPVVVGPPSLRTLSANAFFLPTQNLPVELSELITDIRTFSKEF